MLFGSHQNFPLKSKKVFSQTANIWAFVLKFHHVISTEGRNLSENQISPFGRNDKGTILHNPIVP
jgi:hypothetical protein